ncbi:MAG: hypothetical protein GY854_20525 [Deltaproteobacteria bacterium]|nr:hypothetical protein [Deltaproteobacteria bacterium]
MSKKATTPWYRWRFSLGVWFLILMMLGGGIIGLRDYIQAPAQEREAAALGAVVMFFLVAALLVVLEWRNRIPLSERFRRGFREKQAAASDGVEANDAGTP